MWKNSKVIMLSTKDKSNIYGFNDGRGLKLYPYDINFNQIGFKSNQHLYITSDEEIKEGEYAIVPMLGGGFVTALIVDISRTGYAIFGNYAGVMDLGCKISECRKIIATTDTLLGLLQPSQQFIEKYIEEYNKCNIITEVNVEYTNLNNIYITQEDLDSLNCTDFSKVSSKYGFKYVDDFFTAMNETLFLIDGYKVYKIKTVQLHDIYQDYLKGEFLFEVTEFENDSQLKINPDNTINIKSIKDSWNREEFELHLQQYGDYVSNKVLNNGKPIYMSSKEWIEENL